MIHPVLLVFVLGAVVEGEESRIVRVVSVTNRIVEPNGYQEEVVSSGYPVFVSQPYPIYVDRQPKTYPGFITPIEREEVDDHYGKAEVVRSPVIFTVKDKRAPYPMKMRMSDPGRKPKETPCSDGSEFFYKTEPAVENTEQKINTEEKFDTEKPIVLGGQYLYNKEIPFDYERKETFQTPILIAEEKPGYKYVRHVVGAGVLPVARQFHVLVLEEDTGVVPQDKSKEEPEKKKDCREKETAAGKGVEDAEDKTDEGVLDIEGPLPEDRRKEHIMKNSNEGTATVETRAEEIEENFKDNKNGSNAESVSEVDLNKKV